MGQKLRKLKDEVVDTVTRSSGDGKAEGRDKSAAPSDKENEAAQANQATQPPQPDAITQVNLLAGRLPCCRKIYPVCLMNCLVFWSANLYGLINLHH